MNVQELVQERHMSYMELISKKLDEMVSVLEKQDNPKCRMMIGMRVSYGDTFCVAYLKQRLADLWNIENNDEHINECYKKFLEFVDLSEEDINEEDTQKMKTAIECFVDVFKQL